MLKSDEIIGALKSANFWGQKQDTGIKRPAYTEKLFKMKEMKEAIVLLGVRRAGKSTIAKQFLEQNINSGIKNEQTLYINFEEPIFSSHLNLELIEKTYEAYREIINPGKFAFVVLDEVQNVPGWEKWVRTKQENEKDIKIIVTGSNSKLLASEFSSVLSGRSVPLTVFPLSFKEYLNFKGIEASARKEIILNKKKIASAMRGYLEFGGFPRVVLEEKENKIMLLKEYFDVIVIRDIAARYNVENVNILKALATILFTYNSSLVSIGKLASLLQEAFGQKISLETVSRFMNYFETAFLFFFVPIFSYRIKDQLKYPRKTYCIDSGLRNTISFRFSEDLGKIYENTVFLELKRREKEVYYWRGKNEKEVDFIVREGIRIKELIQVCYNLDDKKTKEREVSSLIEGMKEFKLKQGLIITDGAEGQEKIEGKIIKYIPLWKWLLHPT